MKKTLALAVLFLSASLPVFAVTTRDEALAAIRTLEKHLLTEPALNAAAVITRFAQESNEVTFTIGRNTTPWMVEKKVLSEQDDAVDSLLLAVYLAGNAKSQLTTHKAEDDPYSGWLDVIDAYHQIQTKRKIVIPSIDQLAAMSDKGTLLQHAEEVKAENKSKDSGTAAH